MQYRSRAIANEVKERDSCCQMCGSTLYLIAHHIWPLVVGGPDLTWNQVTYCLRCHGIEHSSSGSAPLWLLSGISRGLLPPEAIFSTASWLRAVMPGGLTATGS